MKSKKGKQQKNKKYAEPADFREKVSSTTIHNNISDGALQHKKMKTPDTKKILLEKTESSTNTPYTIKHEFNAQPVSFEKLTVTNEIILKQSNSIYDSKKAQNSKMFSDNTSNILTKKHFTSKVYETDQKTRIKLTPSSGAILNQKDIIQLEKNNTSIISEDSGFFVRLKKKLAKTRKNLGSKFIEFFHGRKINNDLFNQLENKLIISDVGVKTTHKIINNLIANINRLHLKDTKALYDQLRLEMTNILTHVEKPLEITIKKNPFIILMVGVNGGGKTTTIGKLARKYQSQGKSVMLAAGDTFRAAAVEQLQIWGKRNDISVITHGTGADPASVIFDAIQAAKAHDINVLIIDTAGRLQNKVHLMNELKKIVRVIKKLDDRAPHEIMITLDANTGQNAISQVNLFNNAVKVTGIVLTKLDGTAKGGVIFSIADQFDIPIRYIGIGENIEDLQSFKAYDFIEAIFSEHS